MSTLNSFILGHAQPYRKSAQLVIPTWYNICRSTGAKVNSARPPLSPKGPGPLTVYHKAPDHWKTSVMQHVFRVRWLAMVARQRFVNPVGWLPQTSSCCASTAPVRCETDTQSKLTPEQCKEVKAVQLRLDAAVSFSGMWGEKSLSHEDGHH